MTAKKALVLAPSGIPQQLQAGDVLQVRAPTTANASINMPHGPAPTAPVDGDMWTMSAGLFVQINGATVGPLAVAGSTPLVIGFILSSGAAGTNVGPELIAPRAGAIGKCKVVTKASDASTDLSFRIKQNGTDVFSSDPSVAHGTSAGHISTFTSLTSSPLAVAADDVFTLDILTGTSTWQATIQLET